MLETATPWRLDADAPVAVLGAGLMGHAIAGIFLAFGHDVVCYDPVKEARDMLTTRVERVVVDLATGRAPGSLAVVGDLTQLDRGTAFVTEAAPENLDLKRHLMRDVAQACPNAVLATNTSVYCVRDVGQLLEERGRLLGTHWWNPPHLVPLVEVVQGDQTAPGIVDGVVTLLGTVGKKPVVVHRDTPGFIGNRLQHALWREAMALVEEGICDAVAVDEVVRNSIGLRLSEVGPLENADYVGLDLTMAIHSYIFPVLSTAVQPLAVLREAVEAGHLGAKSGHGFLDWPKGSREETARRLADRVKLLASLASGPPPAP